MAKRKRESTLNYPSNTPLTGQDPLLTQTQQTKTDEQTKFNLALLGAKSQKRGRKTNM
jgi:hypothetical protein